MRIPVIFVGLGPIGSGIARQVASRKGFRIVAAVDVDPAKVGQDLGRVIGLRRRLGVTVRPKLSSALRAARVRPQVAVLATRSSLKAVLPDIAALVARRLPVVSTTEELAYPWRARPALARRVDALAREAGVAVLGTGVNPGFAMDAFPITLTGICQSVRAIRVERIQDARIRRLPFQKKIGAGLTRREFRAKVEEGTVRHVGLAESISMIADALGWRLDRITDEIRPKLARRRVSSRFLTVEKGQVAGIIQDGVGYSKRKPVVTLHMEAYLGAPESYDAVLVDGVPPLHVKALGGFHGDVATASIAVNSIPRVLAAPAGLQTMRSLPIPGFFSGA